MKTALKLEEALQLALAFYLAMFTPYAWWWYWVWFLAPDFSMIGYAVNTRVGAGVYNFFHHKGVAITAYIAGVSVASAELQFAGLVLLGHSAFDRLLGYGLKYADSFQNTHLGRIGKQHGS